MTRFIVVTFFFLAVAFYEMSGGAGFVAEQRIASAETPADTVTRADTTTLAALPAAQETDVVATLTVPLIPTEAPVADEATVNAVVAEVLQAPVADPAPALVQDLRQIIAARVNMREGPGTDYAVMVKLVQGTQTEVPEVGADGWAHVRVIDTGLLGWVSTEFLAASNG